MKRKAKNPVILIIRDGWGYRKEKKNNIIAQAKTPWDNSFMSCYPNGLLDTSGQAVGLPSGYQGNSEVGHLTLGSGRIIIQSLVKINKSIESGDFFKNKSFIKAIKDCQKNNKALHLLGLLQTQGVHSHLNHLLALLDLCAQHNFKNVLIHLITDGRDAPPNESLKHLETLEKKIKDIGLGKIVTVSGRYYAMDRDKRYQRTKLSYNCLSSGLAPSFLTVSDYIKQSHENSIGDEFIKPAKLQGYQGINDGDALIFFNFRTDRPRQLSQALIEKSFSGFKRKNFKKISLVSMTEYYHPFSGSIAFGNEEMKNLLGEVVANNGFKQLRISETEKYAHVTFFFNGQREKKYKNEDRILIPSPKVPSYDLKPEMSAPEISLSLQKEIAKEKYDLIVVNLVNCDMVGHTADLDAIKKAVEAVDKAMGEIVLSGLKYSYSSIVLADHGNAEDKSAKFITSHTLNPVPVIIISNDKNLKKLKLKKGKGLKDIAPTILKIMGIKKPKEMTGDPIV